MLTANGIKGNYLEYKGRPLVRQEREIYYGDMSEKFYVFMMIMSEKDFGDSTMKIPDKVMVQLLPTDGSNKPEKQRIANGLYDAFETACAWLPN